MFLLIKGVIGQNKGNSLFIVVTEGINTYKACYEYLVVNFTSNNFTYNPCRSTQFVETARQQCDACTMVKGSSPKSRLLGPC